jgi:hypothetical protein
LPSNGRPIVGHIGSCENGYTCQIAPSLRLFAPNSLQAYCHFYFSKSCTCNVCAQSHLPFRNSAFRGVLFQTAPAAPSSRLRILSCFLISCKFIQVSHQHPVSSDWWGKLPTGQCFSFPAPTVCAVAFPVSEGTNPSTMFSHSLFATRCKS